MELAQLLYRAESESLDFKRDQYRFAGADDRTKSELLKDILAFANSWRSESARILIGIDASVCPPQVAGINEHFDDATLQQFVHGKTQRTLKFSYRVEELQGLSIGVIEIPVQARPIYLRKDYGKLTANTVYLRRGSSTGEASPDEIAEMGAANSNLKNGDLVVRFAKPGRRELAGSQLSFDSDVFRFTGGNIPDYRPHQPHDPFGFSPLKRPNLDFHRELVKIMRDICLLQETALTVTNVGSLSAKEIRVECVLPDPKRVWEFCTEDDYPVRYPSRYLDPFMFSADMVTGTHRPGEPKYEFDYIDGIWHLTFEFGHLQPGRTLWPALKFYVGAREAGAATLTGKVLADGLSSAATCKLELVAQVTESKAGLDEIMMRLKTLERSGDD